ncbi:MAG: ROK family transcriptional regulator [Pseudomonadota bacterium]
MAITGDQSLLKRINRMGLVRLVKSSPGCSRADLAKQSGLTKSTVSLLIQELIEEGWLCEKNIEVTKNIGRRPTPLTLDGDRLALLGAEIGVDYLNVVACNLKGELLTTRMLSYRHLALEDSIRQLCKMIGEVQAFLLVEGRISLGLGVGVPGVMEADGLTLRFAPNLDWNDVDITDLISAGLQKMGLEQMPVTVLNEANAAALSEYVFGAQYHTAPLIYLSIGVGLGAGIVLDDRLYLGHDGLAGEIGHTILQLDGLLCTCGRHGCAEAYISQRAVSRRLSVKNDQLLSIGELTGRLVRQDKEVEAAVTEAGRYLGLLMQNLVNTLNPAVIVLGGPLSQFDDLLMRTAVVSMTAYGGRFDAHRTSVRLCRFGVNACAVGAAGAILHQSLFQLQTNAADNMG